MQTETKNIGNDFVIVAYPEDVIFAFNPLYLDLEVDGEKWSSVDITVSCQGIESEVITKSIKASMYRNKAHVYISRIVQLMFCRVPEYRSEFVNIVITHGDSTIFNHTFICLWGSIALGQGFNVYGVFANEGNNQYCYRVRKWFKNYPFKLSVFDTGNQEGLLFGSVDGSGYGTVPIYTLGKGGMEDIVPSTLFPNVQYNALIKQPSMSHGSEKSTFDHTFDHTFFSQFHSYEVVTKLIVSCETEGYYLRWIDNFGQLQYYLFVKGVKTIKNKLDNDCLIDRLPRGGMWFPNLSRNISVETTVTHKCCAVNLPEEIWDYVETIIRSPYIDIYVGKTIDGEEIWCPVNIVAASHEYNPKEILHDLEISFTVPTENTQIL